MEETLEGWELDCDCCCCCCCCVPGADDDDGDDDVSFCSTPAASELSVLDVSTGVESGDGSEELPIRTIFLRRELEASPSAAGLEAEKKRPGRCEK